jgi:hypothetical protein
MAIKMKLLNIDTTFRELEAQALRLINIEDTKNVALMVAELRAETPVDTGHAQSSWTVTRKNYGFEVANSAEYIQYLNEGSSKQAPAYFIERIALKYGVPYGTIVETT